ncbi:MAG: T9SS type A sorting domain-containing protein, partial [Saprospiraceae bacterium]
DVMVDTWLTSWSAAALADIQIAGNDTKKYSNVDFLGIETTTNQIDASTMEFFHLDLWTPDATTFKVKLVDFGADGAFGGGDDTEHELAFNAPAQAIWLSYMIPMSDFTGLTATSNIAQLILVAEPTGTATLFVDNVYFSKTPTLGSPMVAAPDPTLPQADVISLFSNVYTDVMVDTWLTSWSAATLADIQIMGNDTKLYENVDFLGIETTTSQIDANEMNYFHFDVWTPNMTTFRVKVVDFGADGAFGGGDDTEHELEFTTVATDTWVTYEIPMSDFTGLTTTGNIAQLIFSGLPTGSGVFYLDNVYYSKFSTSNTELSLAEVNMFPNPASQDLNLTSDENMEQVQLFDSAGKLVRSQTVSSTNATISVATLPEGFYTCLITINGKNLAKPFIKK